MLWLLAAIVMAIPFVGIYWLIGKIEPTRNHGGGFRRFGDGRGQIRNNPVDDPEAEAYSKALLEEHRRSR